MAMAHSVWIRRLAAGALALSGVVLALPSAAPRAQSDGDAELNAVSFLPLRAGVPIRVRLLDDSETNVSIKAQFENALSSHGFVVDAEAPLVLTFQTQEDLGAYSVNEQRYVLKLQAEGGREGGEDASAIVNVFNSKSGGLLNRGDRPGTNITAQSMFRMDATIDDTSNGRRLWEGWSIAPLTHNGPDPLIDAMVPALAAHVGKSASRIAVPIH